MSNDGAIEVSSETVAAVARKRASSGPGHLGETVVGDAQPIQAGRGGQVEAESDFDHRADYVRPGDSRPSALGGFRGKFQSSKGIRLPEINAGAKPIVIIVARLERLPLQQAFADTLLATVITEDERGSEAVQFG